MQTIIVISAQFKYLGGDWILQEDYVKVTEHQKLAYASCGYGL